MKEKLRQRTVVTFLYRMGMLSAKQIIGYNLFAKYLKVAVRNKVCNPFCKKNSVSVSLLSYLGKLGSDV